MHLVSNTKFDANVALFIELSKDRARSRGIREAHRRGRGLYLRPSFDRLARDGLLAAAEAAVRAMPSVREYGPSAAHYLLVAVDMHNVGEWWVSEMRDQAPERRTDGDEFHSAAEIRNMVELFELERTGS